ncbi:MAG: hypothetical protein WCC48_08380 [Anaeromyxobacteraceae bacterium]
MVGSDPGAGAGKRGEAFERFERAVLFLVSTVTLRALGILAGVAAGLAVVAALWFSVPKSPPAVPPEVAQPKLPAKPTVTLEELQRAEEPSPRSPDERPAPRALATEAIPSPVGDAPRTALDIALDPYRELATRLKIPFEGVVQRVCVRENYWAGGCAEWDLRVVRRGVLDLLKLDVFLDGEKEEVQVALLDAARKLYGAIEATAAGPGTLEPLAGSDGLKTFAASYLQPALDLVQGYRKIRRVTGRETPPELRLRLVEDLYPAVQAIVGRMTDASPTVRRATVSRALAVLAKKEAARTREATSALRDFANAKEERELRIAREEAEHAERVATAGARRQAAIYVAISSVGGITLLGILLALLAIERHLRALRDAWSAAQAAPAWDPAAQQAWNAEPIAAAWDAAAVGYEPSPTSGETPP